MKAIENVLTFGGGMVVLLALFTLLRFAWLFLRGLFNRRRKFPAHDLVGNPLAVVTLVHGTFARGAPWTQPGSALSKAVCEHFGGRVQLRRFDWSGRNSFRARAKGAEALAAEGVLVDRAVDAATASAVVTTAPPTAEGALFEVVAEKLAINAEKYPVERARGERPCDRRDARSGQADGFGRPGDHPGRGPGLQRGSRGRPARARRPPLLGPGRLQEAGEAPALPVAPAVIDAVARFVNRCPPPGAKQGGAPAAPGGR